MRFVTYIICEQWILEQGLIECKDTLSLLSVIPANDTKRVQTPKLFLAVSGDLTSDL